MELIKMTSGSVCTPCIESELDIINMSIDDLLHKTQVENLWPKFPKGWGTFDQNDIHPYIVNAEAKRLLNQFNHNPEVGFQPIGVLEAAMKLFIAVHQYDIIEQFESYSSQLGLPKNNKGAGRKQRTKDDSEVLNPNDYSEKGERKFLKAKTEALTNPEEPVVEEGLNPDEYSDPKERIELKEKSDGLF